MESTRLPQGTPQLNGGMFRLLRTGDEWRCEYASGGCLRLLGCDETGFVQRLLSFETIHGSDRAKATMLEKLNEAMRGADVKEFICVLRREGQAEPSYFSCAAAAQGEKGLIGHIMDVSAVRDIENLLKEFEQLHEAGLMMTKRTMYRYESEGRRGIFTQELADKTGLPLTVEDMPHWNIGQGRIAPESESTWLGIFDAIDRGEKYGSAHVIFLMGTPKRRRRGLVEFSGLSDENGRQTGAILSHLDVTEIFDREQEQKSDREGLLQVAEMVFPEMLSVNLTQGTYRMLQYDKLTTLGTGREGRFDDLIASRAEYVDPQDREEFEKRFTRAGLMNGVKAGLKRVQLTYRRSGKEGVWHWMETIAIRQENSYNDDILLFAVSRNLDQQKQMEERLRDALAASYEKLEGWEYYNQLSNGIFPGLTYVSYDDGRESPYTVGRLADTLCCEKRSLALCSCEHIPNEDRGVLQEARREAETRGESSFHAEYRVRNSGGGISWVSNRAMRFVDREGSEGYIHFLTDVSAEHELMERLRVSMEKQLRENERIFNIAAQHSNRTMCYYDAVSGTAEPWNEEHCAECAIKSLCLRELSMESIDRGEHGILPESIEDARRMLREIRSAVPSGEAIIHIAAPDGEKRIIQFKYNSLSESPETADAIISFEDITEEYERQLSHARLKQSIQHDEGRRISYVQVDLTDDRVEKAESTGTDEGNMPEVSDYSAFLDNYYFGLTTEDCINAHAFYQRANMLEQFVKGTRHLENLWRTDSSGGNSWVMIKTDLVEDPINRHIKMFSYAIDVTDEQEELIAINKRADYDAMTGLLRRDAGEARIRSAIGRGEGGVMVIVDLDDLKTINDTLGHTMGDLAIIALANSLQSHFRKGDIVMRTGGDEFVVFLPEAGPGMSSVRLTLMLLQNKLNATEIGEGTGRMIRCSIGCAVEEVGRDSYESLFEKADIALYHVKRHGKNSFAEYEPEMREEGFVLQKAAQPVVGVGGNDDIAHLIEVMTYRYPGVLLLNYDRQRYQLFSNAGNVIKVSRAEGDFHDFWVEWDRSLTGEDSIAMLELLDAEAMRSQYAQGDRRRQLSFIANDDTRSTELILSLFTAQGGELCGYVFFRYGEEKAGWSEDMLTLQKAVRTSMEADIEYICLLDAESGKYYAINPGKENMHDLPAVADFEFATRSIMESQIPERSRSTYYNNANLDTIIDRMSRQGGSYAYRYTTIDGITREASFKYYDSDNSKMLMTVRRIGHGRSDAQYMNYGALVLEHSSLICYIADMQTYNLLYLSKLAMNMYGVSKPENYMGKKCYQVMHGREEPCPFCTKAKLVEGQQNRWERYDERLRRWFDITDTMIWVDGRSCRLEVTRDITARKSGVALGQVQFTMEDVMHRCLHTISTESDLNVALNTFLREIGAYYDADRTYIIEFYPEKGVADNTFEWHRKGLCAQIDEMKGIPLFMMEEWMKRFREQGGFLLSQTEEDPEQSDSLLQINNVGSLMASPLFRGKELVGFVGVDDPRRHTGDLTLMRSISEFVTAEMEKRRLMAELEQMSYTDVATGLKNRNYYNRLRKVYEVRPPSSLGIVSVDINHLREINDTYGHAYGDKLIERVGSLIGEVFEEGVCRMGGDEFAVICADMHKRDFQEKVVELHRSADKFKECNICIGYSWGFDSEKMDVATLLQQAYEMRFAEKQALYHTQTGAELSAAGYGFAAELLKEIEKGRFMVYYQPQMEIRTGRVIGAEALVRKLDEDGNMVPPMKFIPFYEVGGVISHIDLFVLRTATAALRRWMDAGQDLHIAVNFSRVTLLEPNIVDTIRKVCDESGVPTSAVTIEVTESIGNMDGEYLGRLISQLKEAGFSISLDDFGSQYSNLAILATMDFDEIKFDRSLVSTLEGSSKSRVVMKNGMELCRELQGTVSLAEGIETKGQLDLLMDFNCDYGQGYYFSRPLPADEFTDFLNAHIQGGAAL